MTLKSSAITIGWIIAGIAALLAFAWIGVMAASLIGYRYHKYVAMLGVGLIAIAGFGVWLYNNHWRSPVWLTKTRLERACWILGIAGFVLMLWFDHQPSGFE
jgi:hypothetical protein